MKLLFIYPTITKHKEDPSNPVPAPPLGLAYIAGYMEKNGFEVKILDALALGIDNVIEGQQTLRFGLSEKNIINYLDDYQPDIVGICNMFTAFTKDVHDITKLIKANNRKTLVMVGGAHASINPAAILKDENIDIVVQGEGEETVLEIARRYAFNQDLSSVLGITFKTNHKIWQNAPRPNIKDIDQIPFPARHLLPVDIYIKSAAMSPYIMRRRTTTIISSRGCPQHCIYCSIHSVWGNKWRGRSAQNVVDEMEFLNKRYKIEEFSFQDDSMSASAARLEEICDEITSRKLDIKWTAPNGIAHWTLDEELLRKMKKSGCYRLTFGIESGNEDTRKFIGKIHSLDQAKKIIQFSNKIGLWTISTFILGFPQEDIKSMEDTINWAINSETDFAAFYLLIPFPGTKIYTICKQEGLVNFNESFYFDSQIADQLKNVGLLLAQNGCGTKYVKPEELRTLVKKAYRDFQRKRLISYLRNPLRILRKVSSFEDFKYTLRILKAGFFLIIRQITTKNTHLVFFKKTNPKKL